MKNSLAFAGFVALAIAICAVAATVVAAIFGGWGILAISMLLVFGIISAARWIFRNQKPTPNGYQ